MATGLRDAAVLSRADGLISAPRVDSSQLIYAISVLVREVALSGSVKIRGPVIRIFYLNISKPSCAPGDLIVGSIARLTWRKAEGWLRPTSDVRGSICACTVKRLCDVLKKSCNRLSP